AAMNSGDAISVIAWADDAENLLGRPTFDQQRAQAAIESIEPLDTAADLRAALGAVDGAVSNAKQEFPGLRTRVTFISDLAMNTWGGIIEAGASQEELSQSWRKMVQHGEVILV